MARDDSSSSSDSDSSSSDDNQSKGLFGLGKKGADKSGETTAKKKKKKDDSNKPKEFYFRIDKIQVTFDEKISDFFCEFFIGAITREENSDVAVEVTTTKTVTDAEGNKTEQEVKQVEYKKLTKVYKAPAMVFFTRMKNSAKPKETVSFKGESCAGVWKGSRPELNMATLQVKVWRRNIFGPNSLVGIGEEKIVDIISDKMARSLNIRPYGQSSGGARRDFFVARVDYKIEFQEFIKFKIDFRDWHIFDQNYKKTRKAPLPWWKTLKDADPHQVLFGADTHQLQFRITPSREDPAGAVSRVIDSILKMGSPLVATYDDVPVNIKGQIKGKGVIVTRNQKYIIYNGTRGWLEDETLRVDLRQRVWCCNIPKASKEIHLQGILDYGFVQQDLEFAPTQRGTYRDWCHWLCDYHPPATEDKAKQVKFSAQGVVDCQTVPEFKQLGNPDPQVGGGFFALGGPKVTYLVIQVIRAKGLHSIEEHKENLNPSVTIEWNRVKKSTRVITETTSPVWESEVYFKIPDYNGKAPKLFKDFAPEVKDSKVVLTVWDNDINGFAKSGLGTCELDFRDIYYERKKKKLVSFTSGGDLVNMLAVHKESQALENPHQLGPAFKTTDSRIIEFQVYFGRTDRNSVPLIKDKNKEHADSESDTDDEDLQDGMFARAQTYWDENLRNVPNRDKRFFSFFGKDEITGDRHFLPRFCTKMPPPTGLRQLTNIMHFVYCIESVPRPWRVKESNIPGVAKKAKKSKYDDLWLWNDPFNFVSKGKGDTKDHCLLLCNFLQGLDRKGLQAYICVGTARTTNARNRTDPHWWVATIENEKTKKGKIPKVRFWETTNGSCYELGPKRFTCIPPEVLQHSDDESEDSSIASVGSGNKQNQDELDLGSMSVDEEDSQSLDDFERGDLDLMAQVADGYEEEKAIGPPQKKLNPYEDASLLSIAVDHPTLADSFAMRDRGNVKEDTETATGSAAAVTNKIGLDRELQAHKRDILDHLKNVDFLKDKKKKIACPYLTLDVMFNEKHLYANLQDPDPELIRYQLNEKDAWFEFSPKKAMDYFNLDKIAPFYPQKALVSMVAPFRQVERATENITQLVKSTIATFRSFKCRMDTQWLEKFAFQFEGINQFKNANTYMEEMFEIEGFQHNNGLVEKDREYQQVYKVDCRREPPLVSNREWKVQFKKWRAKITDNLPNGKKFEDRLLFYKHSDGNRICESVVAQCNSMLRIDESRSPEFNIQVHITPLQAYICPVRVYVCCESFVSSTAVAGQVPRFS